MVLPMVERLRNWPLDLLIVVTKLKVIIAVVQKKIMDVDYYYN